MQFEVHYVQDLVYPLLKNPSGHYW